MDRYYVIVTSYDPSHVPCTCQHVILFYFVFLNENKWNENENEIYQSINSLIDWLIYSSINSCLYSYDLFIYLFVYIYLLIVLCSSQDKVDWGCRTSLSTKGNKKWLAGQHAFKVPLFVFRLSSRIARMRFDDILGELGSFGPYQRRVYLAVCLMAATSAFHSMTQVFYSWDYRSLV